MFQKSIKASLGGYVLIINRKEMRVQRHFLGCFIRAATIYSNAGSRETEKAVKFYREERPWI